MTSDEVCVRYQIPQDVMNAYESWQLRGAKGHKGMIETEDIEHLSMIVTLYAIGFTTAEVERYMRLLVSPKDTKKERMAMLEKIREQAMKDLHTKHEVVDQIDYLRYQIRLHQ